MSPSLHGSVDSVRGKHRSYSYTTVVHYSSTEVKHTYKTNRTLCKCPRSQVLIISHLILILILIIPLLLFMAQAMKPVSTSHTDSIFRLFIQN